MAKNLYFSRDSKLYVEFDGAVWQIPVLDGFSFSQSTNTSEITLSEMQSSSGLSRRGRRVFTDSLAPVEWSFSTYVRPYLDTNHRSVEEVLWAVMAGADNYANPNFTRTTNIDPADGTGKVITSNGTKSEVVFTQSNRSTLGTCTLYFVMSTDPTKPMVYKINNVAINEASIDFEVDGIATINWSGNGATIVDMQSAGSVSTGTGTVSPTGTAGTVYVETDTGYFSVYTATDTPVTATTTATDATSNFIRNRLTQLSITAADTTTFPGASNNGIYNVTITGGNITISNNITYLTPEELGRVNIPIEHVTGARSITGSFTSYLAFDTSANSGTSSDFFNDLTSTNALKKVVNDFNVTFQVGGNSASTPRMYLKIPKCHIEIPNHSIEDVISIETNFSAYTTDFDTANEVSVEYYGVTV